MRSRASGRAPHCLLWNNQIAKGRARRASCWRHTSHPFSVQADAAAPWPRPPRSPHSPSAPSIRRSISSRTQHTSPCSLSAMSYLMNAWTGFGGLSLNASRRPRQASSISRLASGDIVSLRRLSRLETVLKSSIAPPIACSVLPSPSTLPHLASHRAVEPPTIQRALQKVGPPPTRRRARAPRRRRWALSATRRMRTPRLNAPSDFRALTIL